MWTSNIKPRRPALGCRIARLCGSARLTTVGTISSYHARPKQLCRPELRPSLYVMQKRGHSRLPDGTYTVRPGHPACKVCSFKGRKLSSQHSDGQQLCVFLQLFWLENHKSHQRLKGRDIHGGFGNMSFHFFATHKRSCCVCGIRFKHIVHVQA